MSHQLTAVVRVQGLPKQKTTPLARASSNSSGLPTVLSYTKERVVILMSCVNHTANRSTGVLTPPFPLMISPTSHNKAPRANRVDGSLRKDR